MYYIFSMLFQARKVIKFVVHNERLLRFFFALISHFKFDEFYFRSGSLDY